MPALCLQRPLLARVAAMWGMPAGSLERHEFAGFVEVGPPVDGDYIIAIGALGPDGN
jgi:hypothetical protein